MGNHNECGFRADIELDISIGNSQYKLIKIAPGQGIMGGSNAFDSPIRKICIEKSFYIGKYPVTQSLWEEIIGCPIPSKYIGGDMPLDEVELSDAFKFIEKINNRTGLSFSLPTENQWEYAARGGVYSKGYKLSGGNNPELLFAKNEIEDGYQSKTYRVGLFQPNELGLYDMNSNVAEWCSDEGGCVLKGGVQGFEGGLIWEECSIAAQIGESADSYTPNKGIRLVLNLK